MNKTTTPIQRINPQNVPLEYLEGKRLLSIQEAEALHKRNGLPGPDSELFIWSNIHRRFFPNRYVASAKIVTYATTRPEGFYESI